MTDDPLRQPRMELATAARAIDGMRNATSLDEFESAWRLYLNAIEKLWQKVECCCQHIYSTFQPWQGAYCNLRKKDMLLRYLKQARHADNHSLQDVTKIQPGQRKFRFANPRGGYIKRMEIRNGEVFHYEGDPMIVDETPPHPVAVPVKNRGQWFNPPTSHLGNAVASHHPVLLAELGLKFYETYLAEVATKFFPGES